MSKMDRMLNSKREKQTIYEIYRACRLCGAGAGYKMPIIQNVVDLDDTDVEIKQKIRECVQIEVHQDDKMPPLICELCVDKVNDFYEFLEMCRQTNKRTRLRLGLPPQSMPRGAPDAGECILGLTEPVYVNEDSDGEPLAKHRKMQPKVKVKKEPELKVKIEKSKLTDLRPTRFKSSRRPPTPPRMTRHSRQSKDDNNSLSRMQDKSKTTRAAPKSILKKEFKKDTKTEDTSLLTPRLKRTRDREPVKLETQVKRVKIALRTSSPRSTPKSPPKTSPRLSKPATTKPPKMAPRRPPSPPRTYKCVVCDLASKTPQALISHMRVHTVSYTNQKMACNPCGLWFPNAEDASSHHKHHKSKSKPYNCRRCTADFKQLSGYDEHFENNQCLPFNEVPDVKCDVCWGLFATNKLLEDHKCLGEDYRPGGKCGKCNRSYALMKNLKKHEANCTAKKKGELRIDPVLLGKLKPIQVRVSRCDPLLSNIKQEHYDVSCVTADFGLDKNCIYPYISSVSSLRVKSEPTFNGMVAIKQEIKDEFCTEEGFVHWDSEDSGSDDEVSCSLAINPFSKKKEVSTLAALTLKTLFSPKVLGKVPRKRRRVKHERSMFDSLLGSNDTEDDVTRDINNIIDNLGDDDEDLIVHSKHDTSHQSDNESKKDDKIKEDNDKILVVNDGVSEGDDKCEPKDSDKSKESTDNISDDIDSTQNSSLVEGNISVSDEKNDQNDSNLSTVNKNVSLTDKNDESNDVLEENNENTTPSNAHSEVCDDSVLKQDEKDINGAGNDENDGKITCKDEICSNNDLSSHANVNNDKVKGDSGSISDIRLDNDSKAVSNDAENNSNVNVSSIITEESRDCNDEQNDESNDGNDAKNDSKSDALRNNEDITRNDVDNSRDSNSAGTFNESLLNDNTQSNNKVSEIRDAPKTSNDKYFNDNATSEPEQNLSNNNGNKSQADDLPSQDYLDSQTNDNFSMQTNDDDSDKLNHREPQTVDEESLNSSDTKHPVKVDTEKTVKTNMSEDMDDSKLMEEIDAQIGDNDKVSQGSENFNDKIALEDLVTAKNTEKSMNVDVIPDDFNIDT